MIFFVLALRRTHQTPDDLRSIIGLMMLAGLAFSANVYMNIKIGVFCHVGGWMLWHVGLCIFIGCGNDLYFGSAL